jgi:hypothetical protein
MEMGSGLSGGEEGGPERLITETVEECTAACEANKDCFQYVHDGKTCFLGKAIRRGESRRPEDGKKWRSGWHKGRIADWISKQKPCDTVDFPNWAE